MPADQITYSEKYYDDKYEYRYEEHLSLIKMIIIYNITGSVITLIVRNIV